jgi:hypothetical protein
MDGFQQARACDSARVTSRNSGSGLLLSASSRIVSAGPWLAPPFRGSVGVPSVELPDGRNQGVLPFLGWLLYQLISAAAVSADIDHAIIILLNIVNWHSRNHTQIER